MGRHRRRHRRRRHRSGHRRHRRHRRRRHRRGHRRNRHVSQAGIRRQGLGHRGLGHRGPGHRRLGHRGPGHRWPGHRRPGHGSHPLRLPRLPEEPRRHRGDARRRSASPDGAATTHVDDPEDAEVIVVNTCGFIGEAKKESIDAILEMAASRRRARCEKLVVAGCLSQRYPEELATEMPEVDHFLGSSDMLKLGDVLAGGAERMLVGQPRRLGACGRPTRGCSPAARHSAYVKIAEGCNRTCSFCVIPRSAASSARGPIDDVVERGASASPTQGVLELNLVSQDTIAYGRDREDEAELASWCAAVGRRPGRRWVRLFYLYPETLDRRAGGALREHPKVLRYVDMPLQHAADACSSACARPRRRRLRRVVETSHQDPRAWSSAPRSSSVTRARPTRTSPSSSTS
jgi:hypothetical protein